MMKESTPRHGFSVVFEDDGRVAYAYLRRSGVIVGDVWLYNHAPTPAQPEWGDRRLMPFKNAAGYASDVEFEPIRVETDVDFEWTDSPGEELVARVYLRGALHGQLMPGSRPGWSRLASVDGPLAKVLQHNA